jgi:molybdate transport system substrate-binding protein
VRLATLSLLLVAPGLGIPVARAAAPTKGPSGTITVFAAASLTETFTKLGQDFEKAHRGVTVRFNFAGSSDLAAQIREGAPTDVFASADRANLEKTVDSGDMSTKPRIFARNRLEIVVDKGNPKHVKTLKDLAGRGLDVVLCADAVPCGKFAQQAFANAGVTVEPVSKEDNVKAVVTKVSLGEADAGVVYVTDVKAAGHRLQGVAIPHRDNVVAEYPIAVLRRSTNQATADAWVKFVLSRHGREVLGGHGFLSP